MEPIAMCENPKCRRKVKPRHLTFEDNKNGKHYVCNANCLLHYIWAISDEIRESLKEMKL